MHGAVESIVPQFVQFTGTPLLPFLELKLTFQDVNAIGECYGLGGATTVAR